MARYVIMIGYMALTEERLYYSRNDTREIYSERNPQGTEYGIVPYRQLYQVGYWRVPTANTLPLSRLPTTFSEMQKSAT